MATGQLFKGPGLGTSQWREAFTLTDTDSSTALFTVALATGNTTVAGTFTATGAQTLTGAATLATSLLLTNIAPALTALAGGGQDSAATSTKQICVVTTVTSGNDSFTLPAATGSGSIKYVSNQAASNSLQLFGLGTDTVNAATNTVGIAVTTKKGAWCVDYATGKWAAIVG